MVGILAEALNSNTTLEVLDLLDNENDNMIRTLNWVSNGLVKELNLSSNKITDDEIFYMRPFLRRFE